ncbi:outer membrane protein TOM13-domain-containing protein [Aspergillus pseudoustus]|uniref:Outer membrane protein TOM13-domain-containing protein n=1 Tax=Aspergillus pseudoustus TaxID=1810923 RepID=A0ABR4IPX1_9EURO
MASNEPSVSHSPAELYASGLTIPSDSEIYSANPDISSSTSSDSPLILYKPSITLWGILRGAAINLVLPFVNGLMLGFGELFAHEAAFRLGWSGTKIFPTYRRSRPVAAGLGL